MKAAPTTVPCQVLETFQAPLLHFATFQYSFPSPESYISEKNKVNLYFNIRNLPLCY